LEIDRNSGFWTRAVSESSASEIECELNKLGDQGWELVGVWPVTNGSSPPQVDHALHHFKRAKQQ
jgi:hypothetical protein